MKAFLIAPVLLFTVVANSQPATFEPIPGNTGCGVLEGAAKAECEKAERQIYGRTDCQEDAPVWMVRRATDSISDNRSCVVLLSDDPKGGLLAMVVDHQLDFSVMGEKYPGTENAIRVDGNKAFVFSETLGGAKAKALLVELRAGGKVTTRYNEWPSHVNRDKVSPTCNVAELIDECLKD